jgi:hypothetical protein
MNTLYYGKQRPIHISFFGVALTEEIPPNPEPNKSEDWCWVGLDELPDGKWFRLSRVTIDFYKKLKQDNTLNRAWIDTNF